LFVTLSAWSIEAKKILNDAAVCFTRILKSAAH
jgi:hypothetical protein